MIILFFCVEFLLLLILSQKISQAFSLLFYRITKSNKTTIYLLSLFFLPGVVLHELAHLLVANLLLVQTGQMDLVPQFHGNMVKLGSVPVARTDPLRRFFIGVAPVLVGFLVLSFCYFIFGKYLIFPPNWQTLLLLYVFFEVGNTMFSSKKDMEGALELAVVIAFCIGVFVFFKPDLAFSLVNKLLISSQDLFEKIALVLVIPVGIDIVVYLLARFGVKK